MHARVMKYFLVAMVVLAAPVARLLAHDGHEHRVMGTVTMAAADHVMLNDTEQKPVTVQVTKDTRVLRDKKPIKAEAIPVGSRIVVTALMTKNQLVARTIEVGSAGQGKP
jgi:hypothetical protein